jgi:hypothetical protein
VGSMTKMIMGDACPLNCALDSIRACLRKLHLFSRWSEMEWRSFVWASHVAYRAFMCDTMMTLLAQLAVDMEARRRLDVRVLPDEFRQRTSAPADEGASQKRANESPIHHEEAANLEIRRRTVWPHICHRCWPLRNRKRQKS